MPERYLMKCTKCGAPIADSVAICPYCGVKITFEALGMTGGLTTDKRGGLEIADGAHVVVGASAGETRPCPYCGSPSERDAEMCPHCGSRLVIRSLWMRRLVITRGGSMTVHSGGQVRIGRPPGALQLIAAAAHGDLAAMRARVDAGDELDGAEDDGVGPLHAAAWHGRTEAARFLVAMGATLDDTDAHGRTPLHLAALAGHDELAQVLVLAGAPKGETDQQGHTPAQTAQQAGHTELALRLSQR